MTHPTVAGQSDPFGPGPSGGGWRASHRLTGTVLTTLTAAPRKRGHLSEHHPNRTTRSSDASAEAPVTDRAVSAATGNGAVAAAIAVGLFFSLQSSVFRSPNGIANWLDPAATLGIMAVAVALLMIGGEFDLAGVVTGTTGLTTAILVTSLGWNIFVALFISLVVALAIGFFNGYMVVTTRLPSLIITLAMFLFLRGVNLGGTKLLVGTTQVSGVSESPGYDFLHTIFGRPSRWPAPSSASASCGGS